MTTTISDEELRKQLIEQALPNPTTLIGVDFGQSRDYTAAVAVLRKYVPTSALYYSDTGKEESWVNVGLRYEVRHIERFPLFMSYTKQVNRLMKMVERIGGDVVVTADATGVGRGVIDILHHELNELGESDSLWEKLGSITPCYVQITGGNTVTHSPSGLLNVPKRDLVTAALLLFQDGRVKIAEHLDLRTTLVDELTNFRVKINISTAHDTYEAWRENKHDDLVLALALACWTAETYLPKQMRIAVPGVVTADAPVLGSDASGGGTWNTT